MATKASKKTVASSSFDASGSGSQLQSFPTTTSTPIEGHRSGSSLSPTRYSRLQEKQELQNLNDRLACYIEKVQHLEAENFHLTREIQTTQNTVTREVTNIKSMYERELSDTRKLLDDIAKERAKLEIDTKRLWDNNEELKNQLNEQIRERQIAEENLSLYETRCNDLSSQLNQSETARKKLLEKESKLEKDIEQLKAELDDTRKCLQEETLKRIDLENHIQSLKEEITFKDQVYQQELTELRTRRQVEVSEIDGHLAEQYEAKLQQSLQELRDQYEAQMQANRNEIELLYESKIKNLQSQAQRNSNAASMAIEELKQTRTKIDELNQRIMELEASNNALKARIRDLEDVRENERALHAESVASLEAEIVHLRDQMVQQLQEYQDLMDIKVALDLEIAAYRKLLESEEARLNITPTTSTMASSSTFQGSRSTPSKYMSPKSGKRKRTVMEENEERANIDYNVLSTAKGEIEIAEVDPRGCYIKITNKGNKEIGLSGWQIIHKAGSLETIFKFHRTVKIDAGADVIVWSADVGATHEPPSNIVMKGQKWVTADQMTTVLINSESEKVATSERKRQQVSTSLLRRKEAVNYQLLEDIHHQQGDPESKKQCSLM